MPFARFVHQTKSIRSSKVTFSETSTLILMRPKTQPELKLTWYTTEDISHFKQDALAAATSLVETNASSAMAYVEMSLRAGQIHRISDFSEIDNACGIEHLLSPHVFRMMLETRNLTIERVLCEQERQKKRGIKKCELIAKASMNTSVLSQKWHHSIAVLNSTA
ncbi:hypothetical protein HJC23_006623 [Cyclotella cryptica]|uniref:Uncharacterized protein n=1 Tax=Cyclotella cryptica TaxID=29204 RepID=A0ABD3R0H3_9STRA|eukprot:CCRYP_001048-RA/>CCRYP_001048-RA protein AED:0.19 eAED:0.19 QI:0/-1/0/1/-1/1/1/0/163